MMWLEAAQPCAKPSHYPTIAMRLEGNDIERISLGMNALARIKLVESKLITNFAVCTNISEECVFFIFTLKELSMLGNVNKRWRGIVMDFVMADNGEKMINFTTVVYVRPLTVLQTRAMSLPDPYSEDKLKEAFKLQALAIGAKTIGDIETEINATQQCLRIMSELLPDTSSEAITDIMSTTTVDDMITKISSQGSLSITNSHTEEPSFDTRADHIAVGTPLVISPATNTKQKLLWHIQAHYHILGKESFKVTSLSVHTEDSKIELLLCELDQNMETLEDLPAFAIKYNELFPTKDAKNLYPALLRTFRGFLARQQKEWLEGQPKGTPVPDLIVVPTALHFLHPEIQSKLKLVVEGLTISYCHECGKQCAIGTKFCNIKCETAPMMVKCKTEITDTAGNFIRFCCGTDTVRMGPELPLSMIYECTQCKRPVMMSGARSSSHVNGGGPRTLNPHEVIRDPEHEPAWKRRHRSAKS
jgi:hypothetical protein